MTDDAPVIKPERSHTIKADVVDYEAHEQLRAKPSSPLECRSTAELVEFAEAGKVEIDARVLGITCDGLKLRRMDTKKFCEAYRAERPLGSERFKEYDAFLYDQDYSLSGNAAMVGDDYIPLLGGPFNKQLYYADYLRMHSTCYQAMNHDPIAKRIVAMIRQFVMGKGMRVDVVGPDEDKGTPLWRAFERVNNLEKLCGYLCTELSAYGEIMAWELPGGLTKIEYDVRPGQEVPRGLIPRWRLIDPSVIWEIVTFPEDIDRILYYQWVAPTQYQIYTGQDAGQSVPSSKFIMQQIPPEQIVHEKINCVSNEKRGRSDLFPILGYLKRLRDSVNYSVISDQKQAAWAIDTTIEGGQTDIDAYYRAQQELGTIPPAGSEFVHSAKVKREYLANTGTAGKMSQSFEWCLNMVSIGSGIPVSYFGLHHQGGSTRASALVGTEPVAKMFEERQQVIQRVVVEMARRLFAKFSYNCDVEVTWPEIVTQDRSSMIKDVIVAEKQGYIKKERAAQLTTKELGIDEYDYEQEQKDIQSDPYKDLIDPAAITADTGTPLTMPGMDQPGDEPRKPSAVTSDDKAAIKQGAGY